MVSLFIPQIKHAGDTFQQDSPSYFERDCLVPHISHEVYQSLQKRGFLTLTLESVKKMPWWISALMQPSERDPGEAGDFDIFSSHVYTPQNTQWFQTAATQQAFQGE